MVIFEEIKLLLQPGDIISSKKGFYLQIHLLQKKIRLFLN